MARPWAFARTMAIALLSTVAIVLPTLVVAVINAHVAVAQDADAADQEVVPDDLEQPAPADTAPAPNNTAATDSVPAPRRSYLAWLYDSLGLLYSVIFLGLSFALVAVFVMNLLAARREVILPSQLIEGFEAQLNAKKYQEAYELAKNDDSFLGKVLSAGLARLSSGYPQADRSHAGGRRGRKHAPRTSPQLSGPHRHDQPNVRLAGHCGRHGAGV